MAKTLKAADVTFDSLVPVTTNGTLSDVIANYKVRYVDEDGATATILQKQGSTFDAMTDEQRATVVAIYNGILAAVSSQFVEPAPAPEVPANG